MKKFQEKICRNQQVRKEVFNFRKYAIPERYGILVTDFLQQRQASDK